MSAHLPSRKTPLLFCPVEAVPAVEEVKPERLSAPAPPPIIAKEERLPVQSETEEEIFTKQEQLKRCEMDYSEAYIELKKLGNENS